MLGGAGQYKLPQRLLGAGIGGLAFGDENEPISAPGAIGGYAASSGIEKLVKELRRAELDKGLGTLESTNAFVPANESHIKAIIKNIGQNLSDNDLKKAITTDVGAELLLKSVPGGMIEDTFTKDYKTLQSYYTGDFLDDAFVNNLSKDLPKEISRLPKTQGFSNSDYKKVMQARLDNLKNIIDDYKSIGLSAESLKSTGMDQSAKLHELYEMLYKYENNKLPMQANHNFLISS